MLITIILLLTAWFIPEWCTGLLILLVGCKQLLLIKRKCKLLLWNFKKKKLSKKFKNFVRRFYNWTRQSVQVRTNWFIVVSWHYCACNKNIGHNRLASKRVKTRVFVSTITNQWIVPTRNMIFSDYLNY